MIFLDVEAGRKGKGECPPYFSLPSPSQVEFSSA